MWKKKTNECIFYFYFYFYNQTVGIDKVKTEWPALRGKGKIDETTTHMANPLWYTPQSVECHIVEKLTIAK